MSIRNIKLNLLPAEFRPAPTVTIFPVIFGIIVGLGVLFVIVSLLLTEARLSALNGQIVVANNGIAQLQPTVQAYDKIMSDRQEVDKRLDMFNYLDKDFVYWPDFISNLVPLVPDGVWITELDSQALDDHENGGQVVIKGRVKDAKVLPVAFFMQNLEASSLFSDVKLAQSVVQLVGEVPVQDFQISVNVQGKRDYTPPAPAAAPPAGTTGSTATQGGATAGTQPKGNVAAARPAGVT